MANNNQQSEKLADRMYDTSDYKKKDNMSQGFATTHEQVSDAYTEGTVDGVMENVAGKDIPLQRKGYEK
ncbi:YozQ family protein [Ectobacillus ponti]|uniref:YozQ family protein n=1 Tax=Ectobacillus ponti TaxID=2961894 RepID=A0AA41XBZ1_9BACI|nr:YozQ family protein [Ectobacillus ponti]MCP8969226.1 YozQ family protein [Ectobacillus ponti]